MKKLALSLALICLAIGASAQKNPKAPENSDDRVFLYGNKTGLRKVISIPDVDKFHTYKCDFHMHTFYADAHVSANGRVAEAWSDGLDVIAMTEHVGTHKTKGVMLKDYNLPPKIAQEEGAKRGILVIKGAEITRTKPFGHINALFLTDCNAFCEIKYYRNEDGSWKTDETGKKISIPEGEVADLAAAEKQGAFLIWNHPGWPDKKCDMFPFQEKLIKEHRLHAVELCNHTEWYPKVLDWFDQYHLPMMANSDQHMPTGVEFGFSLRPMTLVFAKDLTEESIREAMFAGRMVAFFDQKLAGEKEWLEQLVHNSLKIRVLDEKKGRIEVTNISDIEFQTLYGSHMNPVIFYPHTARIVSVKKGRKINFINCYQGRATLQTKLW